MRRARQMLGLALWLALLTPATASAQHVEIQADGGPHYAGEPVGVVVVASGFEESPTPEIEIPEVPGQLRHVVVSHSGSHSFYS